MTLEELTERLPILTAATLAIGTLLLLFSIVLFRRSRRRAYWMHRRRAGQRGFRLLVVAVAFFSLSAGLCIATFLFNAIDEDQSTSTPQVVIVTQTATSTDAVTLTATIPTLSVAISQIPTVASTEESTPTDEPSSTLTPMTESSSTSTQSSSTASLENEATLTSTPTRRVTILSATPRSTNTSTLTPSSTRTRQPTTTHTILPSDTATLEPTHTPSPTDTPAPSVFPTFSSPLLPVTPHATPRQDALLTITQIAIHINDDWEPQNPATSFVAGTFNRVYFFIEYENMALGVLWRWALFKDGKYVDSQPLLWGNSNEGQTIFFYGQETPFTAGQYEMHLYLGDNPEPIATAQFTFE